MIVNMHMQPNSTVETRPYTPEGVEQAHVVGLVHESTGNCLRGASRRPRSTQIGKLVYGPAGQCSPCVKLVVVGGTCRLPSG